MNINIKNNHAFDYDPEILEKIKEMIKEGFDKLKSFVKSIKGSKFRIYNELTVKLNDIANRLRNLESFNQEFKYYLFVKSKILYIVNENCKNSSFGHCDFAMELLNFFMDVWNAKIKLNNNYCEEELETYKKSHIDFKKRHHRYRRKFYSKIYEPSGEYGEEEMYNIHASLME